MWLQWVHHFLVLLISNTYTSLINWRSNQRHKHSDYEATTEQYNGKIKVVNSKKQDWPKLRLATIWRTDNKFHYHSRNSDHHAQNQPPKSTLKMETSGNWMAYKACILLSPYTVQHYINLKKFKNVCKKSFSFKTNRIFYRLIHSRPEYSKYENGSNWWREEARDWLNVIKQPAIRKCLNEGHPSNTNSNHNQHKNSVNRKKLYKYWWSDNLKDMCFRIRAVNCFSRVKFFFA